MSSKLWILLLMLTVLPVSCKQSAPAKKSGSGDSNTSGDNTPIDTSGNDIDPDIDPEVEDDPCKNKSDDEDEDEEDEDDEDFELRSKDSVKKSAKKKQAKKKKIKKSVSSLALISTVNYDDDIKSIFSDKCIECHASSDDYPINTYARAKNLKNKILEMVEDGTMPPSSSTKLTSTEKKKIKEWINNGTPQSDDSDIDDEDDEEDEGTSNDCDDDDEDDEDDSVADGDWDDLLKLKDVKKCNDKGFIFDRLEEKCHQAKTASFSCDRSGVVAKFKDIKIDVTTNYDAYIKEGYKLDQCGELNSEPVVFFYKKVSEEEEELKLMIKKVSVRRSAG